MSLLIRKLPLELKYVSQMNLLNSSPRCDSLMLVVRQSHSEAAYGDINISANYKIISAQKYSQCLGCLQVVGLTTGEGLGSGSAHRKRQQLAPTGQFSTLCCDFSASGPELGERPRDKSRCVVFGSLLCRELS